MMKSINKKFFSMLLMICFTMVIIGCQDKGEGEETKSNESGDKEEITIQFGHHEAEVDYETNPYYAYADIFKDYIEEESNGRIKVDMYPNSQLGDLLSMVKQASRGELDIVGGADIGLLASYTPSVQVLSIPYVFDSNEEAMELLDGEFGDELNEEIRNESNLEVISYLPTALRHFSNNKHEIKTPEDMKGLDIRTQEIPIHQTMMESLGANPTAIPFEEVYTALQTGVADGQENAPYTMMSQNLHEVSDYYTLDGHLVNTAVIMINDDFLNELSEEDQELIHEASEEAKKSMLEIVDDRYESDLEAFEEQGIEVTELTDEEREKFRDASQDPVIELLETEENVERKWIDMLFEEIEDDK